MLRGPRRRPAPPERRRRPPPPRPRTRTPGARPRRQRRLAGPSSSGRPRPPGRRQDSSRRNNNGDDGGHPRRPSFKVPFKGPLTLVLAVVGLLDGGHLYSGAFSLSPDPDEIYLSKKKPDALLTIFFRDCLEIFFLNNLQQQQLLNLKQASPSSFVVFLFLFSFLCVKQKKIAI